MVKGQLTPWQRQAARRPRLLALALCLLATGGQLALAGPAVPPAAPPACPTLAGQQLRWIVPNRPGGGYDAYSRLLEPFLEARLNAEVVVVNRPEAGGTVGARALARAAPDGRTLGILNASGLLVAQALGSTTAPHPERDFTVLGRLTRNHVVLLTAGSEGFSSVSELMSASEQQPVVFAVRDLGSAGFFTVPVLADLLGLAYGVNYALVTGYVGSSARTLAVLRGEVDAIVANYDSVSGPVRAGELRPLLQLEPRTGITHPEEGSLPVPTLTGPDGLAAQLADRTQRSPGEAQALAGALGSLVGAGRLLAAPPELPPALASCLCETLDAVVADPGFLAAASQRSLTVDWSAAAQARVALQDADQALGELTPLVAPALEPAFR